MLQAVTKLLIVPTVLLARTPPLPQVSALRVLLALPTLMPMQPHHAKTVWCLCSWDVFPVRRYFWLHCPDSRDVRGGHGVYG